MAHVQAYTTPGGERRFRVRWREGDRRERSRSFHRAADARRWALEHERRREAGELYEAPPQTLEEAYAAFMGRYEVGRAPSTVQRRREAWPALAALARLPLRQVTAGAAEDAVLAYARRAPRQAQVAAALLKAVLRDAAARGQRIDRAVLELKPPTYDERAPRFLTLAELDRLSSWCTQPHLVCFAALSGLRQGEVFALRDSDLSLDDGYVLVSRGAYRGSERPTKSKRARRVYLGAAAVRVLREQRLARPPGSPYVFPAPRGGMWGKDRFMARVFRPAARRAGLEGVTFHDLRHTFASLMIAAGANPLQIARALGHTRKDGSPDASLIWQRYGHLYEEGAQEAEAEAEAAAALDRLLAREVDRSRHVGAIADDR